MKMIKYIFMTLSMLLVFAACSDDDKLIYNPNNVAPGQLADIAPSYVLTMEQANEIVQTFNWGAFDLGYDAAITYTLEADLAGNNFANAQELASGSILTADITYAKLNSAMINLQQKYGFADETEQTVEFRVKGTISSSSPLVDPVYTNVVTAKVTPYSADVEYPGVHVMGDYSGWSWDNAQKVYSYKMNTVYEAWIFFDGKAQNGFKFAIPVDNEWNNASNWGLQDGQTPANEATSVTLWSDGGSKDIKAYSKNYYKFSFDTSTAELKVLYSMNTFGIVGDGVGGWEADVPFDFDADKQVFVATVTVVDGAIKFRADKGWDLNFGQLKDGETGILASGGENINVTAGTYKITVNMNNSDEMTYKIEAATALDPSKITAQKLTAHEDLAMNQNKSDAITWDALDFGDQSPATVNYTVEMALKGTSFADVQTLGTTKETSLSVSGDKYLEVLKALGKDIDQAVDVDVRVTATVSGITNVYTSNTVSYNLTINTPPTYPEELYMTGAEFGNWFNDASGVVKMVPVNGVEGSFWCVRYFTAGQGFKWAPQIGWGSDFAELGAKSGYSIDGGNAVVDADGLYMVYIDMSADKITVEPAKIYGMGDAFGGWDVDAYPFTVSGNKASITVTTDSNLRIYAGSSAATSDWWTREFNIFDGKIVYRGTGGDQEAVPVTAGQKVTLDFNAGTGTIE